MITRLSHIVTVPTLAATLGSTSLALAQDPAPAPSASAAPSAPAPAAAPPAEVAPTEAPEPATASVDATASAEVAPPAVPAEPAPAPEPAPVEPEMVEEHTEVPPAEEAEEAAEKPSLSVGVALRTGLAMTFNNPTADAPTLALADGIMLANPNQVNARFLTGGQLNENVGFTFDLETNQSSVRVLDAIAQLKVVDEFQIWVGQHIPAMERNNFNGPFYNNGWNLPVTVQTLPFDIAGRDRGVTFWGLVGGGVLKYHASIVDLDTSQVRTSPDGMMPDGKAPGIGNARIALRATINLLDPENYYYTSGTYYGSQDTLAISGVFQTQKGVDGVNGEDLDDDLQAFTADLLFEKNLDTAGTFTFNGGYWNLDNTGANYGAYSGNIVGPVGGSSYLLALSWLTPNKIGPGQIQPNVQLQKGNYGDKPTVLDVGVGYIVDGFNHRWNLNFRHNDPGGGADAFDMLQIGAQVQL